jgi:hypothetical protein
MRRRLIPELCPCPNVPNPMDHRRGTAGGCWFTMPQEPRSLGTPHHPSVGSMAALMRVPGAKIPLPPGFLSPLPADPIPEGPRRLGMGSRSQARWLPADRPEGWQSGQALTTAAASILGIVEALRRRSHFERSNAHDDEVSLQSGPRSQTSC